MYKKITVCIALALFVAVCSFAEDPVEGFWKSIDEKTGETTAFWKIYDKSGVLFGEILKIVGKSDDTIATGAKESYRDFPVKGVVNTMRVVGTPWIYGLSKWKTGEWYGGSIVDAKKGDIYSCKITYHAADGKRFEKETLEMRGEIIFGIGRSQFWQRASEAEFR
ncbi:MAG: DUF2147 domain-containing protein [Treponemataceae bacterium]